jgi:hypothetical protein
MMVIEMDYENSSAEEFSSIENITIPINQEIRLSIEEPRLDSIYMTVGDSNYVSFNITQHGQVVGI